MGTRDRRRTVGASGWASIALAAVLLPCAVSSAQSPGVATLEVVTGAEARTGDTLIARDGRVFVLEGIRAPDPRLEEEGADRAREGLDALVRDRRLRLAPARALPGGLHLATVLDGERGESLALRLLRDGLVAPHLLPGGSTDAAAIAVAATTREETAAARVPRRAPAGRTRGIALGLYSRDDDYDYGPLLDEVSSMGASHLLIIVPWFLPDWEAVSFHAVAHRTASFAAVTRVLHGARDRGLGTAVMPIVLLESGTDDHWRGDLRPASVLAWFDAYGRLLGRFADVAEAAGAELLVVGSEFSTLEKEEAHWRALIATLRLRFRGELSYSANWDHLKTIAFWDVLDVVGMTGYHSLTKVDDPTLPELRAAWGRLRDELMGIQTSIGRPLLFTEIGYASIDGINRDPWNYTMANGPDLEEQADCFRGFFDAWRDAPAGYRGAYVYNWWRNGDESDRTGYTVKGKPAEAVIRRAFEALKEASNPSAAPRDR